MTALNVRLAHGLEPTAGDASTASSADGGQYDSIDAIDKLPVRQVPLRSLESGLFLRGSGTDPAHVRLLADAACVQDLPPILVQELSLIHISEPTRP